MRKAGLDSEVLAFFPSNRRTMEHFMALCDEIGGMDSVVAWQTAQELAGIKRALQEQIIEMVSREEADAATVIAEVEERVAAHDMKETDVISLLWSALMNAVDWP